MLLTEKNNGYVKGRAVFNGKKSHVWMTTQETDSTTTANENIIITDAINDKEVRYVMGVDLPNEFIKT